MNRKQFISTVASATATSIVGAGAIAASSKVSPEPLAQAQPEPTHKIRRGVSLYSYQEAHCIKGFTLEQCFEELSDMGAYGFEFMLHWMPRESGYPNVSTKFIDQWWNWMDKYGTIPATYCAFPDGNRQMELDSDDENVEYHIREFKIARQLGFTRVRFSQDRVDVINRLIPVAEKLGLWMGREFHSPVILNTDKSIQIQLALAEKYPHVYGFVPDMGIFQKYPRPLTRELQIREGSLTRDTALYIENSYRKGMDQAEVAAQVKRMKPKPGDTAYVETVFAAGAAYNDPKDLIPWIPYCKHIHGKCHELTKGDQYDDTTHTYQEVVPVLIEHGFEGYIATEFEGQRLDVGTDEVNEFDEVRRWQLMMKNLLGV